MSTAISSTEAVLPAARRAVADVRHLAWFRLATMRRRRVLGGSGLLLAGVTLGAAVLPRYAPGAGSADRAFDLLILLPSALGGFLLLAVVSAAASGGGREMLARDPATVHPISPTTDHLGALLLAPLNIAWLLQVWILLGATAYGLGTQAPWGPAQAVVLLWVAVATALAQAAAWLLEGLRRLRHGRLYVGAITLGMLAGTVALVVSGGLAGVLDAIPTKRLVPGLVSGFSGPWAVTAGALLVLLAAVVVIGAVPAHLAARALPRDELSIETGSVRARATPRSALGALVRLDRASVWRAVPMRRGIAVLALGPGAVALLGNLSWSQMTALPGLVASGGALLFGVNAWCLDGRGALWRESLPADPGTVFVARVLVLAEFLLVASLATVLLAALRAGVPSPAQLAALACTLLVVTLQVVGCAMRWSARHPYAVDLRSARATPAPPLSMVGYAARLALSTTLTGLVFFGMAAVPEWRYAVLVAVPFLCWSLLRLVRTHRRWLDPVDRARVVVTVAS